MTFPWLPFSCCCGKWGMNRKKKKKKKKWKEHWKTGEVRNRLRRQNPSRRRRGGTALSHFPSQSVVKTVSQSEQAAPSQRLLLNSPFHACRGRGGTHFAKHERTLYMAVPSDSYPLSKYWHGPWKASCILLSCIRHFVLLNYWYSWKGGEGVILDTVLTSGLFFFNTSSVVVPVGINP